MKKLKYILTSIFLVLVSLVACGCGAVTLVTELSSAGQVRCTLSVSLSGLNNPQRKSLYELLVKYSDSLNDAYKENLVALYGNIYDYAEKNLDTLDKQFQFVKTQDTRFLTSDDFEIEPKKNWAMANNFSSYDRFSIQMSFASVYGYIMFFCPKAFTYDEARNAVVIDRDFYTSLSDTPVSVTDYEVIEKTFTVTYLETCAPFYYNLQEPYLVKNITISADSKSYTQGTPLVETVCDLLGVSSDEAHYLFGFSTPYKRLHANTSKNDMGIYVWDFGNNLSGTIQLWRKTANQAIWYVISLACGILVFAVGGTICAVIKRNKTKKGMNALQNIQHFVTTTDNLDKDTTQKDTLSQNDKKVNISTIDDKNSPENHTIVEKTKTIVQENESYGELHDEVQKALGEKEDKMTKKKTRKIKKSKKNEKE